MIIERPILRYHGGKFILADWIITFFPKHKVYVEPFGGAASVLLKKPRSYAEIYNELDCEIVNLFRVCRDNPTELINALFLTPYARDEFELSYLPAMDLIEKARRTIVRSLMGFASGIQSHQRTGFRANSNRSGSTPAHDWINFPEALQMIVERLRGVVIENRDAIEVMQQHDSKETLHYLDPPYVKDTRYKGQRTKVYKHELDNEYHNSLCSEIKKLEGFVIVSGYENEIYNDLLHDWKKVKRKAFSDGARERVEVLWLNRMVAQSQRDLFNSGS